MHVKSATQAGPSTLGHPKCGPPMQARAGPFPASKPIDVPVDIVPSATRRSRGLARDVPVEVCSGRAPASCRSQALTPPRAAPRTPSLEPVVTFRGSRGGSVAVSSAQQSAMGAALGTRPQFMGPDSHVQAQLQQQQQHACAQAQPQPLGSISLGTQALSMSFEQQAQAQVQLLQQAHAQAQAYAQGLPAQLQGPLCGQRLPCGGTPPCPQPPQSPALVPGLLGSHFGQAAPLGGLPACQGGIGAPPGHPSFPAGLGVSPISLNPPASPFALPGLASPALGLWPQ